MSRLLRLCLFEFGGFWELSSDLIKYHCTAFACLQCVNSEEGLWMVEGRYDGSHHAELAMPLWLGSSITSTDPRVCWRLGITWEVQSFVYNLSLLHCRRLDEYHKVLCLFDTATHYQHMFPVPTTYVFKHETSRGAQDIISSNAWLSGLITSIRVVFTCYEARIIVYIKGYRLTWCWAFWLRYANSSRAQWCTLFVPSFDIVWPSFMRIIALIETT